MCRLVRIFYFNFQVGVFAAFTAHAALFCRFVQANGGNVFTTKMQVHHKARCRNKVKQRN